MDSGVLDLLDEITALRAEIKRLRGATRAAITALHEGEKDPVKVIRKLELEFDRVAPSTLLKARRH
jgi:hypothetical protein